MRTIKCDLCKKEIDGKPVTAGIGVLSSVELCKKCGSPILDFLKSNKLFEGEIKTKNQTTQEKVMS